jgi:hypothetical protein
MIADQLLVIGDHIIVSARNKYEISHMIGIFLS